MQVPPMGKKAPKVVGPFSSVDWMGSYASRLEP